MIAADIEAFAAVCDRTDQHCLVRTKVVARIGFRQFAVYVAANRNRIEDCSCEVTDFAMVLMGNIPRHRERLQIYLGTHDRGSETQQDTAFEPFHSRGEDKKIRVACLAKRCTIAVWMF